MSQSQGRRPPKVLVAVLTTGVLRWELSAWLNHLVSTERRGSLLVQYFGGDAKGHPVNSNRNRILREAPLDVDAVLMLDEDTIPHPATIEVAYMCCPEEIGGLGLDVVLAPVPILRSDDERGPVLANLVPMTVEGGNQDDATIALGANRVEQIREGGTGVIAISRRVIDHPEMVAPFQFEYDADGVTIVGEDHYFCRRAWAAGFEVCAALGYIQGHVKPVDLKSIHDMYRPVAPRPLKLIVTGTGRCGTGFAAHWLTSAGLKCGHEALFMYRGIDAAVKRISMFSEFQADASWMAAPFLDHETLADTPIIHQIRHPKKVIASWIRKSTEEHTPRYWRFLVGHYPEIEDIERDVDQYAARYVLWNEMIEARRDGHDYYRWRVEDGEDGLLAWLVDRELVNLALVDRTRLYPDRTYNHKGGPGPAEVGLGEISEPWRARLAEMAERYGYQW